MTIDYTRRREIKREKATPLIDTIKVPTNEEGRIIPILFGTKKLKSPHLLWYGDVSLESDKPIVRRNPRDVTSDFGPPWWTGNNYQLGLHLGYCMGPIDKITKIEIGDLTIWSGTFTGGELFISKYLGEQDKGGIYGTINVVAGHKATTFDDYLRYKLGNYYIETDDFPNFGGIFSIIAQAPTIGTDTEVKPWDITATRIQYKSDGSAQWYHEKADINGDMNPIHIIRECFADHNYGMGYPDSYIDDVALAAAADTLYSDGLGMSMLIDRECTVQDIISEVEDTVDGVAYFDRNSGKLSFKLIRNDYDINTIPVIDNSNTESIQEINRNTNDELPNSISLKYWNKDTAKEASLTIRDTALAIISNGIVTEKLSLLGITSDDIASKVASRELLKRAFPLIDIKIYCDSALSTLNIADVFILNLTDYGITNTVFRVVDINIGSFTDRKILISAIEEYSQPFASIFTPPSNTEWEPVSNPSAASPYRIFDDTPMYILRTWLTENQVGTINPEKGIVMYTGTKPTNDTINLSMMIDDIELEKYAYPAPTGTITEAMTKTTTTIISDIPNISADDYLQIDDEIIGVTSVTDLGDGTYQLVVTRGCMDTVPESHVDDSRLISLVYAITDSNFKEGTVTGKISPRTLQGLLDWDTAPEDTATILPNAGRFYRPIAPGNVTFSGEYWPASLSGIVGLNWEPRDRNNVESLIDFYDTGIESEPVVEYDLDIYDADTETLLAGYAHIGINQHIFELDFTGNIRIELSSVRENIISWQKHIHEVYYTSVMTGNMRIAEDDSPDPVLRILENGGIRIMEF